VNCGDFAANASPDQNGSPYCGDGRFFEFTINSNGVVPASGAVARCSERVVAAKVPTVTMARVATIAKDMSIIGRILWLHLVDAAARISQAVTGGDGAWLGGRAFAFTGGDAFERDHINVIWAQAQPRRAAEEPKQRGSTGWWLNTAPAAGMRFAPC